MKWGFSFSKVCTTLIILFSWVVLAQDTTEKLKDAQRKFERGNYIGSIETYNEVIEMDQANFLAYQERGRSKRFIGNLQEALNDYNTSLRINPNHADAYIGRGQTYIRTQNYEPAIQDYNLALQAQANSSYTKVILYNRGLAKQKLADYQGALQDYNQILDVAPEDVKTLVNRGLVNYLLDDPRAACEDWIKAKNLGNTIAKRNAEQACQCCM